VIFKYRKEEHTQSTDVAAGRAGHDRQRHLQGDLPLSLQPLKVQYPEQHYTVPLRGTVQMLLHYPPPGKKRVSMTRVVFLYLQLSINVLVVYAVREAHSTKQGFFSGSEKVSLNREPVFPC